MIARRALPVLGIGVFFILTHPRFSGGVESYPAIMMPSFAGAGGPDTARFAIARTDVVISNPSGETVIVTPRQLFASIPDSHHGTLMQAFSLRAGPPGPMPDSGIALPGLAIRMERIALGGRLQHTPGFQQWLRREAIRASGLAEVGRLEFRWIGEVRARATGSLLSARELGSYVISF